MTVIQTKIVKLLPTIDRLLFPWVSIMGTHNRSVECYYLVSFKEMAGTLSIIFYEEINKQWEDRLETLLPKNDTINQQN